MSCSSVRWSSPNISSCKSACCFIDNYTIGRFHRVFHLRYLFLLGSGTNLRLGIKLRICSLQICTATTYLCNCYRRCSELRSAGGSDTENGKERYDDERQC